MNQVTLLRQTLRSHLPWHGARLTFVALFLIALFRVKTVNFTQLATAFIGPATTEAHYKRIQRFFRHFEWDYYDFAQVVVALMNIPEPWTLSLDRTEWRLGKTVFNILTLGIVHDGVAFPVLWWMLDKKGNSNTPERIELLNDWHRVFPERDVACLTADREFLGTDWLAHLLGSSGMQFRIRIRESDKLDNGRQALKAKVVFADLALHQTKVLAKRRRLWGHWVYVTALRLEDNSLLIVVTNHAPKTAVSDYAKRWGIETLFGIFKTRGFCLESTRLRDSERLSRLFAVLTLGLCWAFRTGQWRHQLKPITIKKHGRRAKSIFRVGFDHLRHILLNLSDKTTEFEDSLRFLSCT
jgi:hypothetical protein